MIVYWSAAFQSILVERENQTLHKSSAVCDLRRLLYCSPRRLLYRTSILAITGGCMVISFLNLMAHHNSKSYLCLSAFLLLHDGRVMSTRTCGNSYRSFSSGARICHAFFSFHSIEFKAPGFTKHYENVNLCILNMTCLHWYSNWSVTLVSQQEPRQCRDRYILYIT